MPIAHSTEKTAAVSTTPYRDRPREQHPVAAEAHHRQTFRPLPPAARVPEGVHVVAATKLPLIVGEPT
jgi:hypothetical protein